MLTDQKLEVLTERDKEHEVIIDLGLPTCKAEGVMSGIGNEGSICEGGVKVVKGLSEGQKKVKDLGQGGVELLNII